MAIQDIWKLHSVQIDDGTPVTLGALTSTSMPTDANIVREITSGDVFATSGRIEFKSVGVNFTTAMVGQALAEIGVRGACIAPGGTSVHVFLAKYDCSGPVAGAVHRKYTMTKGMFVPNSMSVDHQGDLSISYTLTAVADGVTTPVTFTDAATLPTITNVNDRWTMSEKCTVNAQPIIRKKSINVDFGVSTSTQGADSDAFDTFASIDSVLPVVTVQGVDIQWFDNLGIGITGKQLLHANTSFAFRKRDTLDATAEHIVMTASGPAYFSNLAEGNATDAAQTTLRIEPIKEGATAPLVITLNTAI